MYYISLVLLCSSHMQHASLILSMKEENWALVDYIEMMVQNMLSSLKMYLLRNLF